MTKTEQFLIEHGHDAAPLYFEVSTATVPLAAQALGVEEARIAKSMALAQKDGRVIVLVTCGTARIDNQKYKQRFACKAKMLSVEETLAATGHPVGGVCPFALPDGVDVYLDESLRQFETVYPAAGTPSSAVRFTPDELERVTGGEWVDLCKLPEGEL